MKYTKQNIQKKRQILSSEKIRRNSKISLFLFKYAFIISIALIVTGLGLGVGFVRGILKTTPQITKDSVHSKGYITTIYDNKGSTIKTLSNHDSNRIYTPLSSIPKNLPWYQKPISKPRGKYYHATVDQEQCTWNSAGKNHNGTSGTKDQRTISCS